MAPRLPFLRRITKTAAPVDLAAIVAAQVAAAGSNRNAPNTPAPIEQSMAAQGMDSSTQMGPGRPLNPSWGYSTRPRAMDYRPGVNISVGDNRAAWGRTPFSTLRAVTDAYDVARMCINHKTDELLSMEPLFLAADGFSGDAEPAIAAARAALEFPDRELPYDAWLSKWLEDVLTFDAGTLYRRRNLAGQVIGLEVIDGTTIKFLVDEYGRRPLPPAPAWQQVIRGMPTKDFTADDLIPTIRRPQTNSPFGLAPMESILLTVNTDLRYQKHFLELFTDGTTPQGLMKLPEGMSSPDQVAEFQDYWDAMMLGDQAALRQLKAVPFGTDIQEFRPKDFNTEFAEYLMSRTAAAFGVVPQDLGLVKDVNRASGETQTDIQFRVNTLPWVNFVQGHLTRYLRYDLGLPVQVKLDTGRDKADRLQEAQAWQIYVDSGAASVDEMRQELLGLPIDNERPMPRFINSPRTGPVPLHSVFAIAGPINPETGGPADDAPIDTTPFDGAGAVLPDKTPGGSQFKRAPIDPDDPAHPDLEHVVPGSDVLGTIASTKPLIDSTAVGSQVEADQAQANAATVVDNKVITEDKTRPVAKEATAGITAASGLTGVDLVGAADEDDEEPDPIDPASGDGSLARHELAKAAELASFARFSKAAGKAGRWRRDFTFTAADPLDAHRLNQAGRAQVRKAAGQLVAAGLAVVAADTGRVLMLQRALDSTDANGGTWEFPGGCIEDGESAPDAAIREWQEETGCQLPAGTSAGGWASRNGLYEGLVWVAPSEDAVPIFDRAEGMNPDDPDGDAVEALAWWDPALLVGNPAVRPELAADLDTVLYAIAGDAVKEATPGKAASPVAKSWRDGAARTPQHEVDLRLVDHYAPLIAAALAKLVTPEQIRAAIEAARQTPDDGKVAKAADSWKQAIKARVVDQLTPHAHQAALEQVIRETIADGWTIGGAAASRQLGLTADGLDWATWQPGDAGAALQAADGGLASLLDSAGVGIKGIVDSSLDDLGNAIADGVGSGLSVDDIASSLSDWATGFRAERIAQTESARSVTAATLSAYEANGVGQWTLVLSDGACPECEDVADNGPYPASDSEDAPPIHPMCRCAASPVTNSASSTDSSVTTESGDSE